MRFSLARALVRLGAVWTGAVWTGAVWTGAVWTAVAWIGGLAVSGCYQSHLGDDGERCGSTVCTEGNRCCTTCGVPRCTTLDVPCPVEMCDGCTSDADCAADRFCRFRDGACGAAGECAPIPEDCSADCPLVCGCDGRDYCNACEAARAGVSVERAGSCVGVACGREGVVCAVDQICCPLCEGDGVCAGAFEPCPDVLCPPPDCRSSSDCPPDQWCDFVDDSCGGPGICRFFPGGCDDDCPGVCGCDGARYCNDCNAAHGGVDVGPIELCDRPCGRGGEVCAPSDYCDLGDDCGALDGHRCLPRPGACPDVEAPVCGCDGVTYPNACYANTAGTTVARTGPCEG